MQEQAKPPTSSTMTEEHDESAVHGSQTRSPRFSLWVAFLVFSTITLGSSVEIKNKAGSDTTQAQKWAVACSSITFALTAIVVIMHLIPIASVFIVGTKAEGILCVILVAFWTATVAIVSDPDNGLAVNEEGTVSNGNLYYFSWAGFICSIMLAVSYLRDIFNVDVAGEIKTRSARLTVWAALLATSLIVMGSCATIFDSKCTGDQEESDVFCKRTKYGIALGAVATTFTLVVVGMKIATSMAPFMMEAVFSVVLTIMYAFGVAFLTSAQGPGAGLSNLYYFTWISLMLTLMLGANCFEDYQAGNTSDMGGAAAENEGGMQVESLDDTI